LFLEAGWLWFGITILILFSSGKRELTVSYTFSLAVLVLLAYAGGGLPQAGNKLMVVLISLGSFMLLGLKEITFTNKELIFRTLSATLSAGMFLIFFWFSFWGGEAALSWFLFLGFGIYWLFYDLNKFYNLTGAEGKLAAAVGTFLVVEAAFLTRQLPIGFISQSAALALITAISPTSSIAT